MTWHNFLEKTTRDFLIALLITYFFLLIPEIALPGIVSAHFSPKYFLALVILVAGFYAWLERKKPTPQENTRFRAISKSLTNAMLFVITAMIVLSLYKMKIWQIFIVTPFSIALFITAEKMLFDE